MRLQGNPILPPPPGSQPVVAAVAVAAAPTMSAAPGGPTTIKEIYVPGDQVGRIIGRQGGTIRTIQELSGAHADIESSDGTDGRRCIKVRGTCWGTLRLLGHPALAPLDPPLDPPLDRLLGSRSRAQPSRLRCASRTLTASCAASRCPCRRQRASTRAR